MERKEILRFDEGHYAVENRQLSAIWSAVFSSKMDSAFYDSNPNSYIVHYNNGQFSTELVIDRSLLCFSPSGNYIAFSNQRYIDYQHHPDYWGHQPSGNIFIHKVSDAQHTLLEFNDFAEGIKGVCRRAGNVASAAFSQDESRLLAVGSDGTVVVRNLNFPEEK
jgi:WD40 repeat protein